MVCRNLLQRGSGDCRKSEGGVEDLCAVLTPCGPLKLLINLAQTRNEAIPALLYEGMRPIIQLSCSNIDEEAANINERRPHRRQMSRHRARSSYEAVEEGRKYAACCDVLPSPTESCRLISS